MVAKRKQKAASMEQSMTDDFIGVYRTCLDGNNGRIGHLWTMENSSKLKFVHWTSNHCPLYVRRTCPLYNIHIQMDPMDKIHNSCDTSKL